MRFSEIDSNTKLPTTQYSLPEKPTAPRPPKVPTAAKAAVKPKAKIKPLTPKQAMVASLQQKIQVMRDKLKAVRQSQKQE